MRSTEEQRERDQERQHHIERNSMEEQPEAHGERQQDPPVIISISVNQTVSEGDVVTLNCTADGNPTPNITWRRLSDNKVVIPPIHITGKQLDDGDYRCTADNGVGKPANDTLNIFVQNYGPENTNLTTNLNADNTVVVNTNFKLICSAQANPPAKYRFYKEQENLFNSTTGSNFAEHKTSVTEIINEVKFSCTPFNDLYGDGPTDSITATVHHPPDIVTAPSSRTVIEGDRATLFCNATGNPPPSFAWVKQGSNFVLSTSETLQMTNLRREENGAVYTCKVQNNLGSKEANVTINVLYEPSVTIQQCSTPVTEGGNVTLQCTATGNPAPSTAWIRASTGEVVSYNEMLTLPNIKRNKSGSYECFAWNGIGNNSTKSFTVDVQFPPQITKPQTPTKSINFGESASIECLAEGNPQPQYKWKNSAGEVISTDKRLSFSNVDYSDGGNYTCTATNIVDSDSFTIFVKVTKRHILLEVTVEKLDGVEAVYQREYEDLNSEPAKAFIEKFEKEMDKVYASDPSYNTTVVTGLREGSVIVSFVLYFTTAVSLNEGLAKLRFAAEKGNIGPYTVGCLKIIQDVNPTSTPVLPARSTDTVITKENTTPSSSECKCSCNDAILGAVIGILIFIIILLNIYIVWQRRKGATENNRPHEVHLKDAGFYDNDIPMEDVEPNNFRPSNSTQQATFPGPTYMGLQEATRSGNDLTDQTVPSTLQAQRPSQSADYAPLHPSTRSWEVARNLVTIEKVIGKGAFGQVAKGTAMNLRGRPGKTTVAVKMLKATAPESDRKDLLSELEVMKTLKPHPHVIKLLGCVTESESLLVLIEYVPYGDLLGYLRKSRGLNDTYYKDPDIKPQTSLTSQQLMKFSWQIADGMSYLSSRSIIHRDLAARNVLVGEREICKVTDFGMARDVQQENIYERKTKGRLPVKWTAYEALLFGTYTTKSDVWSYGVVLYEICTIGGSPYPRMDGRKIANLLQEGYRMPKPQHVDDKLYQIMMKCWQNKPEERPSFTALTKQLKEMENQHKKLINMHIYDNQLYAKVEDLNV